MNRWLVTNLAAPPAVGPYFRCRHCKEFFVPERSYPRPTTNDEKDACLDHERECRNEEEAQQEVLPMR